MKKIFITILFLAIFIPKLSLAAEISLYSVKSTFVQGEQFLVEAFLDTEGAKVNAVEGVVVFPEDVLDFKEVRDGNSLVNFWVEKPDNKELGEVSFSGITTGGFSDSNGSLFSIIFEVKAGSGGMITLNNIRVLENDGLGTVVPTTKKALTFYISKETGDKWVDSKDEDVDPPEDFTPFVSKDPSIFDGEYFVVFSTTDKGVGIDHYKVREGLWGDYVIAQSPYLLQDQFLGKNIYIVAVDKSGNERTAVIKGKISSYAFRLVIILGIISIVCIYFLKKKRSKFLK